MKIRIIRPFRDMELNRDVTINEEYNVTDERYKELKERVPTFFEVIDIRQEEVIEDIKEIEEQTQDLTEVIEEIKPKKRKR